MSTEKPTLSLCMIMKNEERWIAQCLQSVQGLVDEIVIVDTGSTDHSIEIAKSYGAKVYEHPWEDDFSKSRNRSLDYATSDWILVLDADEVIGASDKSQILEMIQKPPAPLIFLIQTNYIQCSETYGWVPNTLSAPESNGYPGYVDSSLVRLFKRESALFQGVVHEHAEPVDPTSTLYWSHIRVHHYGKYSGAETLKKKNSLYFRLGKKKLEENPTIAQPYYEMGAQYLESNLLDEAQEVLLCGEKIAPHMSSIQLLLAHIEMKKQNISAAIQRFLKVLELEPKNVSPYIYLPGLLIDSKQYELAEDLLNRGEAIAKNFPPYHINRGALKMRQGNYRKAIKSYLKAIEINPQHYIAHISLAACYVEIGEWSQAETHYHIALESPQTHLAALKGLGVLYFKKKDYNRSLTYIEKSLRECSADSLDQNLLHLWKAIILVTQQDYLSAKQSLQKISNFNEFEEVHLTSLNDCLKKISAASYQNKGVTHGNQQTHM